MSKLDWGLGELALDKGESLVSFNQFLVNNMAKTKHEDQAKLDSSPSSRLKYAKYVEQCGNCPTNHTDTALESNEMALLQ